METLLLAVNGTLMRGFKLNPNMINVGATFVEETQTDPQYRLWSIDDDHPGMIRVKTGGVHVVVELWAVPAAGLAQILQNEPAGLSIGKVQLIDGRTVLGVLAEPWVVENQKEISSFGGWKAYAESTHLPN